MTDELPRISVVGLGRLGAPMAAGFAHKGFRTIAVDVDGGRVDAISQRRSPIFEPGLHELLQTTAGRLQATRDYAAAVRESEVTFIVVPTPSDSQGGFSLGYVLEAAEQIGAALRRKAGYHLVVLTSTVMPGATEGTVKPALEKHSAKKCGPDFGLCYNPEFIALGSVLRDFLNPDFILIGESDPRAGALLNQVYRRVCENDPPIARLNFVNAELAKLGVNTFVTTKISFANMLARLCERLPGACVDEVTRALGLDSRIGRKYLTGAVGYGGPCFPRDNLALAALGRRLGAPAVLAEATHAFNQRQGAWLAELVQSRWRPGRRVGILGVTYKPNSNVVEEAEGLHLAQRLAAAGVPVVVYDPQGMANAQRVLGSTVAFADSCAACIRQADVLVVATPWDEFRQLRPEQLARSGPPRLLIDCWRIYAEGPPAEAVEYLPLGVGHPAFLRND